jgi:hypothetical protein
MKSALAPRGRIALIALPIIAAALGVAFARTAPAADPPKPSPPAVAASPAESAPAAAPQVPSAASSAEAAPPIAQSITEWIPPEEPSDKPKPDEWSKAVPLALVRSHPRCTASALREWLRVSCVDVGHNFKGVRVLGGSEQGVHIEDYTLKEGKEKVPGLHVMLPVRRGDRRILSINSWESAGYKSWALNEDLTTVISALWLPGDRGPTITVHGAAPKPEQAN